MMDAHVPQTKTEIRKAVIGDGRQIAQIHIECISEGFLSRLGEAALGTLYDCLIGCDNVAIFVALVNGEMVGFSAGSTNISETYRTVFSGNRWKILTAIVPRLVNFTMFAHAWQTFWYPTHKDLSHLPAAESLSTGIKKEYSHLGLAYFLVKEIVRWMKENRVAQFKAIVFEEYKNNKVLGAMGFRKVGTIVHHKKRENVYVYDLQRLP